MKETRFWEQLKSGHFARMVKEASKGQELSRPIDAYYVLKPLFTENDDVECLYCIFLDLKNSILSIEKLFSGTLNCASIFPREIVKRVVTLKAGAVLMAHNHPSGDITPSSEDLAITRKVLLSLMTIDVLLHDHLIVGNGYHSLSDAGWMQNTRDECQKILTNAV